ncbi:hypothetical protein [Microbispora amethystogenes]|uniref:Uncharacterized protein n=1 Tax=Microbispora amethystogenes TaxID=1427754 RepID=A0ABQ4FFW3_9ACTN|nr:hypothetical protein [Microbispora amethystogenes]GIH33709.1 hypothetical protein Mam01_38730 [Microbispora amethystogenes]
MAGMLGCSPWVDGKAGIGVDEAGNLLLVLAWCGTGPNVAVVYHKRESGETVDDARYEASKPQGRYAAFRLDAPSGGWKATQGPLELDPAITYTAAGGNGDTVTTTGSVDFGVGDAAKLKPGLVLVQQYDDHKEQVVDVVIPVEQFQRSAQRPENCK